MNKGIWFAVRAYSLAIAALTFAAHAPAQQQVSTDAATVATPVFSPKAGTYTTDAIITITDVTAGVTIYYTTNGTTPTAASTKYTAAIRVSDTETIKAIAVKSSDTSSAVASATYTLEVATPVFSPRAGTYTTDETVT